jgi:hypothetical protein
MRVERGEAAIVIDQPPEIEFRNGMFIAYDPILGTDRAMRPITFLRMFERAAKAIQTYHGQCFDGAEIIEFPKRGAG